MAGPYPLPSGMAGADAFGTGASGFAHWQTVQQLQSLQNSLQQQMELALTLAASSGLVLSPTSSLDHAHFTLLPGACLPPYADALPAWPAASPCASGAASPACASPLQAPAAPRGTGVFIPNYAAAQECSQQRIPMTASRAASTPAPVADARAPRAAAPLPRLPDSIW